MNSLLTDITSTILVNRGKRLEKYPYRTSWEEGKNFSSFALTVLNQFNNRNPNHWDEIMQAWNEVLTEEK